MKRFTIAEVLTEVEGIDPFPRAAIRVLELSLNGAPPLEIASVIESDPGLTVKLLRLCNSARYAGRQTISSVREASVRLGARTIADLAMTSGCASFFTGYGDATRRSNTALWSECLHVAFFARHLAGKILPEAPLQVYTIGMLQNLGHVLLDRYLQDEQDEILARIDDGMSAVVAEREVLGMDHSSCGAYLARKWHFPEPLAVGVRRHHNPRRAPSQYTLMCAILRVAEGLALETVEPDGLSLLCPVEPALVQRLGISNDELDEWKAHVRDDVEEVMRSTA